MRALSYLIIGLVAAFVLLTVGYFADLFPEEWNASIGRWFDHLFKGGSFKRRTSVTTVAAAREHLRKQGLTRIEAWQRRALTKKGFAHA